MTKNRKTSISLILGMVLIFLIILSSCSAGGRKNGVGKELPMYSKPAIDSSIVLETLELYRAKRYEGIQEALNAGADTVHKLVLYGRELGTLPSEIGKLSYLQTLDVAYNKLSELPAEISDLHYLQGFYANGNQLTAFPEQLLLLPILKSIDLSENRIDEIPGEIVVMDQLYRLSLNKNMLTSIPAQLYELNGLAILELEGNGLGEIPWGIDHLPELKKLDLSNNQLKSVPEGLFNMSGSLKDLYLQGNQIPRADIDRLIKALPDTKIRF